MLRRLLLATTALFSLSALPAHAMPAVVGAIPALLGGIGAGGLTLGGVAIGLASLGAQWLLSKMLTPEQKQRGVKGKIEMGGGNSPKFIVGEYATPGMLAYRNTLDKGSNIPEACLVDDICLSALPIDSVSSKIYINSEGCNFNTGSDWSGFMEVDEYIKGGDKGGYCLGKFHLGDQTNADNWMLDKFGGDDRRPWANDIYLPGCGEAIMQSWYSNRGIWSGWPEFRFVVRGLKLYDPRKDSTVGGSGSHRWGNPSTWEFTRNPKVIEYNIIRGIRYDGERVWGGDAEAYRLPLDYWFAAMNVCDETITKKNGDVIKRYEIGAEISFDDRPIDIINEINKSCDGFTTEYGGTYKTWCGGPGLAVGTITDDDWLITAEMETNPFQARQNTFNTCYTTYTEPRSRWEVKEGPRYIDHDAVDEDGEELALDLALPFVTENNQAQRLARSAIRDSRRQVTHAGQLPPFAYVYEPFDRLVYVSEMFGYTGDGKDFMVASKEDLPNVNQQILLREMNPGDTGWLTAYEQDTDYPELDVVKPGDLELAFTVSADEVTGPAGRDKPAIKVEWDWADRGAAVGDLDVRHIDWRIRRAGSTKWMPGPKITDIAVGEALVTHSILRFGATYEIQLLPVPFSNRVGAWGDAQSVTMVAVAVPTGLTLTQIRRQGADGKNDFFVRADWDDVAQETDGYGVRIVIDGDTRFKKADGSGYEFPVKAPETVEVTVRTRAGSSAEPSDWCTPVTINVTKKATGPAQATGLVVKRRPKANRLRWNRSTDSDYKESAILRRASVSDPWVEIDRVSGTTYLDDDEALVKGTNYKYKIVHYNWSDVAASDSAEANNTFEMIGTSDTDRTTLAAPTGISLTQANRDVDKDGTVDIALLTTFSGSVAGATGYEVEWVDSAGQTASARADTGKFWFMANTTRSYQARWRAYDWTNQPGTWSSYSGSVTPAAKSGAPANPSSIAAVAAPGGFSVTWTAPTEFDYFYSEVGVGPVGGVATILDTVTSNRSEIRWDTGSFSTYIWVRHFNTSGLASSWVRTSSAYTSGKIVTMDSVNLGTSGGGIDVGSVTFTLATVTFIADSNATGITVNLGSTSWNNVAFVNNESQTFHSLVLGGGTISFSKSGGGTFRGAVLTTVSI